MQQPQETVEVEKAKRPRGRPRKVALENPNVPEKSISAGSQAREENQVAGVSHAEPMDVNPSTSDPLPLEQREVDLDGDEPGSSVQKRPRKQRSRFSEEQSLRLLREFEENNYLTKGRKNRLATDLGLSEKTIHNWFQNRRQKTKMSGQAVGVSQSEPTDVNPSASGPLPDAPNEDEVQILHQVEGTHENPDQDHEPLRPLKLARTDQEVRVDPQIRNEFVDILGTPNGDDSETSNVGVAIPEQQQRDPQPQSGSHAKPRVTRNQERKKQETEPEVPANADQDDDGKVDTPVLRSVNGTLVFRGYKPGMTMAITNDGKRAVYPSAAPLDPDAASYLPIRPNTLVAPVRNPDEIGSFIASQSTQNRNSVRNNDSDDSDTDDPSFRE